ILGSLAEARGSEGGVGHGQDVCRCQLRSLRASRVARRSSSPAGIALFRRAQEGCPMPTDTVRAVGRSFQQPTEASLYDDDEFELDRGRPDWFDHFWSEGLVTEILMQ